MSKFHFIGFMDASDGRMARVETLKEEIPVNIFIDNASQFTGAEKGFCTIDVCGVESVPTTVFASEEEYIKSGIRYAPVSLVPIGTFSPDPEDEDFEQSPTVLFAGKVKSVERDPDAAPDMPNCCAEVETLDFTFSLYFRWDKPIEEGYILRGIARLFGDISFE